MTKILKKHSSFLAWVFLPSLLLVTAVLGVNIVSRPSRSALNSACSSTGDCTANPTNSCLPEFCNPNDDFICDPVNTLIPWVNPPTTPGSTCACNHCGNGRCEPDAGEDSSLCPADCPVPPALAAAVPTILGCAPGVTCNADPDACCPAGCNPPTGASCFDAAGAQIPGCDPDCCRQCGDGIVTSPEECDPGTPPAGAPVQPACATGETCVNCLCVTIPTSCPTDPTVPLADIQCIPDGVTQGCNDHCQCQSTLQGGGPFITGCGGRITAGPLNAACVPLLTGAAGTQTTIVPPSLFQTLNPSVLGGVAALIGVPGGVFAVTRWRKKRK